MVDKVTVNPLEVRGAGDIVSPKTLYDFGFFKTYVNQTTDTVNGLPTTVFIAGMRQSQESLELIVDNFINYTEDLESFTVVAVLRTGAGAVLSGKTVTCTVNNDLVLSGTTNSQGRVSFTVPVSYAGKYSLSAKYTDTTQAGSVAGVVTNVNVFIGELENITVLSDVNPVGAGEESTLLGEVDCLVEYDTYPAEGVTLSFYEEYFPDSLGLRVDKSILTGDTVALSAKLLDTDGSIIQVSGETVSFYEEFVRDNLTLNSSSEVILSGDVARLSSVLTDVDGSLIGDVPVFFEAEIPDSDGYYFSPISTGKEAVGVGEVSSVSVRVRDLNNDREPVSGVSVRFYVDEDEDNEIIIPVEVESEPVVTSVALTGNKNVLSAYDSDTATLTATVKDQNGNVMSGESVVFKQGGTTKAIKTTNSSGVATYTYNSQGVGDVSFTASVGSVVSGTYSIEDCLLYDLTGFSKTTTSSTDTTYKSGYGYSLPSTENFEMEFDYNNPAGFRLYFANSNINDGETFYYGIGFTRDGNGKLTFTERTTSTSNTTCQSINSGTNHYRVVFTGNTVNVWVNDVQQVTDKTLSWWSSHFPYYFNWAIWATGTGTVTNIKIKPL